MSWPGLLGLRWQAARLRVTCVWSVGNQRKQHEMTATTTMSRKWKENHYKLTMQAFTQIDATQ
jgi:hypothetical protein